MKRILRVSILIVSLFLVTSPSSQAAMNGDDINETQEQSIWQHNNQEPETSSIGADPGIPEAPIDSNVYILLVAVLVYGLVSFRKEKKIKFN